MDVGLTLPSTLSPSKLSSFTSCALQFKYNAIDKLPQAPTAQTFLGTTVHRALELLFRDVPPGERDRMAGLVSLDQAWFEAKGTDDWKSLALHPSDQREMYVQSAELVENYFDLENPNEVNAIGIELQMEAQLGSIRLRGILDRLDATDEGLIVVDYKTGKVPDERFEKGRLDGMAMYSFMCEQVLGHRPAKVVLMYLAGPTSIIATPSDHTTAGLRRKAEAVWSAVERACETDGFQPRPSKLCDWCAYKPICPAHAA
jgi:putative RecB family exonuclease